MYMLFLPGFEILLITFIQQIFVWDPSVSAIVPGGWRHGFCLPGACVQLQKQNNKQRAKLLYNGFSSLTEVGYKALQLNSEEEANTTTAQETPRSPHVHWVLSGRLPSHMQVFWTSCSSSLLLPWHLCTSLCLSLVWRCSSCCLSNLNLNITIVRRTSLMTPSKLADILL